MKHWLIEMMQQQKKYFKNNPQRLQIINDKIQELKILEKESKC